MRRAWLTPFIFCICALAACGGGGGGGGGGSSQSTDRPRIAEMPEMPEMPDMPDMQKPKDPPDMPRIELHERPFDGDLATLGTPSSLTDAEEQLRRARQPNGVLSLLQDPDRGGGVGVISDNHNRSACPPGITNDPFQCVSIFRSGLSINQPPRATQDTQAEKAWRMGWTGKGVKVAVFDDFGTADAAQRSHGYFTRGRGGANRAGGRTASPAY